MTFEPTTSDRPRRLGRTLALSLLAVVGLTAALPRLPADKPLPQSGDSPAVVTFSHKSHVDEKRPDCTTCHPKLFAIVETAGRPPARITHKEMEAGKHCGACHDGKQASSLEDCETCHRGQ